MSCRDVLMWVGSGSKFHAINIGPSRHELPRAHDRVQHHRREGQRIEINGMWSVQQSPDREKWEATQGCETIKLLSRTLSRRGKIFRMENPTSTPRRRLSKIREKDKKKKVVFFLTFFPTLNSDNCLNLFLKGTSVKTVKQSVGKCQCILLQFLKHNITLPNLTLPN